MKAVVVEAPGAALFMEEVDVDEPLDHEVVVRTIATGVCHSDLTFYEGRAPCLMPTILGHEVAGVVEAVGFSVTDMAVGDHVVGCVSVFCGHCEWCISGRPYRCKSPETSRGASEKPRLSRRGGSAIHQFVHLSSFAERLLVHEHALVVIRPDMPLDRAALLGCGVLTGVGAVMNTAKVPPGSTVAIFGAGAVGLSAIQGARLVGARTIIAIDILASKLDLALALGATHAIDASHEDPVKAVLAMTNGGVEHAIEAIGRKDTMEQAFRVLAPCGTATVVGLVPSGTKVELDARDLLAERRLQGSPVGSNRFRIDIPQLVDFYMQGRLRLDELISRRATLADLAEAFAALRTGDGVRTVLML